MPWGTDTQTALEGRRRPRDNATWGIHVHDPAKLLVIGTEYGWKKCVAQGWNGELLGLCYLRRLYGTGRIEVPLRLPAESEESSVSAAGILAGIVIVAGLLSRLSIRLQRDYRRRMLSGREPLLREEIVSAVSLGSDVAQEKLMDAWLYVADNLQVDPTLLRPSDQVDELLGPSWLKGFPGDWEQLEADVLSRVPPNSQTPSSFGTVGELVRYIASLALSTPFVS